MARKKAATDIGDDAADNDKPEKARRVIVRAKTPMEWGKLLRTAHAMAWRRLRVEIQVRDRLLAGKPANLDAANAMLRARGLEDHIEAVADIVDPDERARAAQRIAKDEGLCEFWRRSGKPGVWIPSNHLKAMLKENWSVLGLRVEVRGSRGALAEGLFVGAADVKDPADRDWIYLGEAPAGIYEAVAHMTGPTGPVTSIKRHEYVERVRLAFEVMIATAKSVSEKISDDEIAKTLVHACEHGTGACRSQGFGKFDVVEVKEIGGLSDEEVAQLTA